MTDQEMSGCGSVAAYNPGLLSKQELVAQFTARRDLLDRLVDGFRRAGPSGTVQHHLLVGQRGMGKTMLLRRLGFALEDDPKLSGVWVPLSFPEEQYNLARLSDLWTNCLDALADVLANGGREHEAKEVDEHVRRLPSEEAERERLSFEALRSWATRSKKRLVLLLDNIDLALARLSDEHWKLRKVMGVEDWLAVVGGTSAPIEVTFRYDEAFYDFFEVHTLRGLDEREALKLVLELSRRRGTEGVADILERDPGRFKALHLMTGGNPRTLVLLQGVLSSENESDIRNDIERLLDEFTPLYKARFEQLSPQHQQLVDALAQQWDPMTAVELATLTRINLNAVSSQLVRLAEAGLVERVRFPPQKKNAFQIAERFFNIWYLMRAGRRLRRRLIWFVKFLRLFFGQEELERRALRFLRGPDPIGVGSSQERAEYAEALADCVENPDLSNALREKSLELSVAESGDQFPGNVRLSGGAVHLASGRFAEAEVAFRKAVDLAPKSATAWNNLGATLRGMGRHEEAEGALREAIEQDPAHAAAWHNLGLVHIDQGRLNDATADMRKATDLLPNDATSWRKLGLVLGRQGDHEGAEASLRRATECDPLDELAWRNLTRSLWAGGRREQAMEMSNEAARLMPESPAVLRDQGICLAALGHLDGAEGALRKAIDLGTEDSLAWRVLGAAIGNLGRHEEAETAFRRAVELDDDSGIAWRSLGIALGNLGRHEEAETAFRRSAELDEDNGIAWRSLGIALGNVGQHEEARSAFERATILSPDDAAAWRDLGVAQWKLGERENAVEAMHNSTERDPRDPLAWRNLGSAEQALGRPSRAKEAFRHAIELAPDDSLAWNELGVVSLEIGQPQEAENAWRRAIELNSEDQVAWLRLGIVLARNGEEPDAECAFREAVELAPEWADARNALAWFLYSSGRDLSEAADQARRAVDLFPDDPNYAHTLASILLRLNSWDSAAPFARTFVENGGEEFAEAAWADIISFFREAVSLGHGLEAADLLANTSYRDFWKPLEVALRAAAEGDTARLERVAPEIRIPATELFDRLTGPTQS